jgi:phosphatidylethanolamine-binding protein (PEBP) family uncharacterized protein
MPPKASRLGELEREIRELETQTSELEAWDYDEALTWAQAGAIIGGSGTYDPPVPPAAQLTHLRTKLAALESEAMDLRKE